MELYSIHVNERLFMEQKKREAGNCGHDVADIHKNEKEENRM